MTESVLAKLGIDRLPTGQRDRRVTELLDLAGRVAVVTGGGGANIGSACVDRLASAGATVVVLDKDIASAAQSAERAQERWGVDAVALPMDVTDWHIVHGTVDQIVDRNGRIDIWVNNAGGAAALGAFLERTREQIDLAVAQNLLGVMYCAHAVLPVMIAQGSGRLINIASDSGKVALPNLADYGASKAGIIGFTRNLAAEVGPHGVSVVSVSPGMVMNEERIALIRDADVGASDAQALSGALGDALARTSLRRVAMPTEIANVVAFLASDAASYVHGTTLSVSGGLAD